MISNELLKKIGLYFVGNLSSKILSAILLPIFAFNVTSSDLGQFDFSQTLMAILSPIVFVAIWEAVLKFLLTEENEHLKRKLITTITLFSLSVALIFGVCFWLVISSLNEYTINYFFLVTSMIIVHSFAVIWQYYTRAFQKNKLYVLSGVIATIVNFVLIIVLVVLLKLGLLGMLIAYNLGQLSIVLITEFKLNIRSYIKLKLFDFALLKKILTFSSPLVLNLISGWLIVGFGKVLITIKLGTEVNGLFSFSSRFALIITMFGSVVAMALIEEAIMSVKRDGLNKNFNKSIDSIFKIFQSISLMAVPAIVLFYGFLRNTDYYESLVYAPWLLLYAIANTMAINIGSAFQAIGKTKYQFYTTFMGGIISSGISVFLIDHIGVTAVIISCIIGATVMMVSRYFIINKFINFTLNWKSIVYRTLFFIAITLICLNTPTYISFILEIVIIITILYENRGLVKKIKKIN